ncbi:Intraflagellar transport protein 43 like protein [Aduncisulcus paluster]|uniref:Intraflagellar transport protein 43 like protein n=1 Tax=Aduncisulcus paluster TaxID=2918883 RepID=A0ABQ5K4G8_9EUKA|nr:Intraflagellar transport protein 43 like protein [Aduncisulcus paluster]
MDIIEKLEAIPEIGGTDEADKEAQIMGHIAAPPTAITAKLTSLEELEGQEKATELQQTIDGIDVSSLAACVVKKKYIHIEPDEEWTISTLLQSISSK